MTNRDPFQALGIPRTSTQSEILEAYTALKNKYSDERFAPGEAGADAARKLGELYDAYNQAMDYCARNMSVCGGGAYSAVDDALKAKDYAKAQRLLDDISTRDAEWHYLQAAVYYNNDWLAESKRQLEVALELDPQNKKYRDALNKLKSATDGSRPFNAANAGQGYAYGEQAGQYGRNGGNNVYEDQNRRSYRQNNNYGERSDAGNCCNMCSACICADCCCECMGGDLIACC